MRMWRTMFSISTIASSTSTPATRPMAMVDMKFMVIPNMLMNQKAGMAESGMEIADISVARISRRKMRTTSTARTAPSSNPSIAELYCALV